MRSAVIVLVLAVYLSVSAAATEGPHTNSKIEHMVVLMLENRAFDHICGWLGQWGVHVDGLNGTQYNVANGTKYYVKDECPYINPFDPKHSLDATTNEVMGVGETWVEPAPMSGFAQLHFDKHFNEFWKVMHGFKPDLVPSISTLAKEFAVFDRYYASLPGPTYPNRMFFHSGTSHGHISDNALSTLLPGVPQKTMFDVFNQLNISWAVYYSDVADTILFDTLRTESNLAHLHPIEQFYIDAKAGKLPQYTWVTPRFFPIFGAAQDQHPDHDIVLGEEFIAAVYQAVRNAPTWNKSALVVTYDEHGGLYDHVSPPMRHVPNPDGINATNGFNFTRLGVRVCQVVASPWVKKGTIISEPEGAPFTRYEHGSMFQTLRKLWDMEPELTKRTAFAASYHHIFNLETPRTDTPKSIPTPTDTTRTEDELMEEQQRKPPNCLQKRFYGMLEGALGREQITNGAGIETQEAMGLEVHQMMERLTGNRVQKKRSEKLEL